MAKVQAKLPLCRQRLYLNRLSFSLAAVIGRQRFGVDEIVVTVDQVIVMMVSALLGAE